LVFDVLQRFVLIFALQDRQSHPGGDPHQIRPLHRADHRPPAAHRHGQRPGDGGGHGPCGGAGASARAATQPARLPAPLRGEDGRGNCAAPAPSGGAELPEEGAGPEVGGSGIRSGSGVQGDDAVKDCWVGESIGTPGWSGFRS